VEEWGVGEVARGGTDGGLEGERKERMHGGR